MREEFQEQLEKMFPNGYLIVYPTDSQKQTRSAYFCPSETEACKDIWFINEMIQKACDDS